MFLGACSGCIEVPTPLYYWNPYVTHAYSKSSSLQIANILRFTPANNDKGFRQDITDHRFVENEKETLKNTINEQRKQQLASRFEDVRSNGVLDYSRKKSDKCTLPSALEPLKALCSEGPRGLRGSSPGSTRSRGSRSPSTPPQREQLKFGISKILSDDFGKEKAEKDRSSTPEESPSYLPRRTCECTYDNRCQIYRDHMRYGPHALSAVHALQPPKYPTSSNGTDVLPGPYSVLNTEVSLGSQSKRKRSWSRAVFSNLQRKGLEKRFEVQKYVTKPDRRQLAAMLGLTDAQVKVWFQNRRMKWRHAQQVNAEEEANANIADDKHATSDSDMPSNKEHVHKKLNTENIDSDSDDEEISVQDNINSLQESM